jgi:hypothetical protein
MHRALGTMWVFLPIGLSVIFVTLFFPVVQSRYDLPGALLCTFVGVCVIWASYLARAHIFSSWVNAKSDKQRARRKGDPAN